MKPFLLFLLGMGLSSAMWAQDQAMVDSLLRVAETAPHDTQKVEAYIYLVSQHRYQREPALAYAQQGLAIAQKAQFKRGLFNLYNQMGVVYDLQSEYQQALKAYESALEQAKSIGRRDMLAMVYTNRGLTYSNLGSYDRALEQYFAALEQYDDTTKFQAYRASAYNNIGIIYSQLKSSAKARAYFEKALATLEGIDDPYNYAAFITNLANEEREERRYDLAISLFEKAYEKHLQTGNRYGQAMVKYNIGVSLMGALRWEEAMPYLLESAAMRAELGDRLGRCMSLNMLSNVNIERKKTTQALAYSDSALALAQEIGSVDMLFKVYRQRWYILRAAGKTEAALEAHLQYKTYSDSMKAEEADKRFKELEVRYEVAQKDQQLAQNELALLDQRVALQKRNFWIGGLSVLLVLLVVLGLVLRSRYRYKQQQLRTQEALRMQKEQLEAVISAQEAEKFRFAQDLHDGMGQLLTALRLSLSREHDSTHPKSEQLVDELYRELRHLAYNIMPQTLLRKGLSEALRELMERMDGDLPEKSFVYTSFGLERRLPLKTEQLLYRIVQELLANILKHGEANRIDLNLVADSEHLNIMLENNGPGFDPALLQQSKGHGWANVQSRLQMLGASMQVDSRPNRPGTTFSIDLPLSPRR